jgi:hypothetical protein
LKQGDRHRNWISAISSGDPADVRIVIYANIAEWAGSVLPNGMEETPECVVFHPQGLIGSPGVEYACSLEKNHAAVSISL